MRRGPMLWPWAQTARELAAGTEDAAKPSLTLSCLHEGHPAAWEAEAGAEGLSAQNAGS